MTETEVWLPELRPDGRWLARWIDKDGRRRRMFHDTYEDALATTRRHNKGRMRRARPYEAPKPRRAEHLVSPRTRFRVLERSGFRCGYCGRGAPEVALHVDHVLPLALGGTSVESNLVAACDDCNLGKSAGVIGPSGDTSIILALQAQIAEHIAHADRLEGWLLVLAAGLQSARVHHGYCEGDDECPGCAVTAAATPLRTYVMGIGRRPKDLDGPE